MIPQIVTDTHEIQALRTGPSCETVEDCKKKLEELGLQVGYLLMNANPEEARDIYKLKNEIDASLTKLSHSKCLSVEFKSNAKDLFAKVKPIEDRFNKNAGKADLLKNARKSSRDTRHKIETAHLAFADVIGSTIDAVSTAAVDSAKYIGKVFQKGPEEVSRMQDAMEKEHNTAKLRDAARVASGSSWFRTMDASNPISDTPVFDCKENEKRCTEVGDLTTMPESVKSKIREDNFTGCNFVAINKTRLSEGSYKHLPGIVAGRTDEHACDDVFFQRMSDRHDEYFGTKNKEGSK